MTTATIVITLDSGLVARLDQLVSEHVFPNRRQAIQHAVTEVLDRRQRHRLAQECAKLNPCEEQALAEEGMEEDCAQWPASSLTLAKLLEQITDENTHAEIETGESVGEEAA